MFSRLELDGAGRHARTSVAAAAALAKETAHRWGASLGQCVHVHVRVCACARLHVCNAVATGGNKRRAGT